MLAGGEQEIRRSIRTSRAVYPEPQSEARPCITDNVATVSQAVRADRFALEVGRFDQSEREDLLVSRDELIEVLPERDRIRFLVRVARDVSGLFLLQLFRARQAARRDQERARHERRRCEP
jgi:hypothetical protein